MGLSDRSDATRGPEQQAPTYLQQDIACCGNCGAAKAEKQRASSTWKPHATANTLNTGCSPFHNFLLAFERGADVDLKEEWQGAGCFRFSSAIARQQRVRSDERGIQQSEPGSFGEIPD